MPLATPAMIRLSVRRVSRRTGPGGAGPRRRGGAGRRPDRPRGGAPAPAGGGAVAAAGVGGGGGGAAGVAPAPLAGPRGDARTWRVLLVTAMGPCGCSLLPRRGGRHRGSPSPIPDPAAAAQGRPPWPGRPARATMASRHHARMEASHHGDPGPTAAGQLGGHRPQPRQPGAAGRGRRARRAARRRPGPDPGRLRRAGHRRRLRGRALPAGLGGLGRAGRRAGQGPAGPAAGGQAGLRPRAGRARDHAAAARGRPVVRRPDRLADRPGRGRLGGHLGPQRRPRPGPLGPHPRQPDRGHVHRPGRPDPDRGRRPAGGQRPRPRVRQHRRRPGRGRRRPARGGHHPDRARPDLRPLGDPAGLTSWPRSAAAASAPRPAPRWPPTCTTRCCTPWP